jgi:hypothetical protein
LKRHLLLTVSLLVASTRASGADVAVFVGPCGGVGNVLVLDRRGRSSWPESLQGIVLLPLECTGRTRLGELLPDRARLRLDVPGAARLQLPLGRGSLYRYRRDDAAGGRAFFGFFVVDPDGRVHAFFEQAGTGSSGTEDPLATHVAVSRRGDAILLGTRLDAGGDLLEVDLETGRSVNRTEDLAPQSFRAQGLDLMTRWGVGLSDSGPLRFSRLTIRNEKDQVSTAKPILGWPEWTGTDLVHSADESTVAVIAGWGPSRAFVHVFGQAGPALRATHVPAKLSGACFLPEQSDGPTLALSPDGARVAWRSEGISRECWLRDVRAPEGAPDLHVTSDANFKDTLNDTGVIAFLSPDDMIVLVGEGEGAGMERADLFQVHIESARRWTIANLSRTGPVGDLPPFDYGRLVSSEGIHQLPGTPAWLAFDRGGGRNAGSWLRLDASGRAPVELLSAAGPPRFLEVSRSNVYSNLEGAPGSSASQVLIRLALDEPELTSWSLPGDAALDRVAISPASDELAAVLAVPEGEFLILVEGGSAPSLLATSGALAFGPTLGFADGTLYVTAGRPGDWTLLALSRSSTSVLAVGLTQGFVLPGG